MIQAKIEKTSFVSKVSKVILIFKDQSFSETRDLCEELIF